jgi:hypothetical protein
MCVCRLQADIDWTCAGHLRRWGRIPQVPPVLLLPPLLHSHQVHAAAGGLPAAAAAAGSGPPGAQSNPCMIATRAYSIQETAYSIQGKQVLVPSAAATRQRLLPLVMHTTPAGNYERCWFVKGAVSYLRANTLYCLPVLGSVNLKLLVAFLPALEVCVLQNQRGELDFQHVLMPFKAAVIPGTSKRGSETYSACGKSNSCSSGPHLSDADAVSCAELVLDLLAALQ